jgi:anti-sigma-K factor RskA
MTAPQDNAPETAPDIPADEALAMDYALGALERTARQDAALRLSRDPAFRARVEAWQAQLAPLNEETTPVLPPASVWAGVSAEIGTAAAPSPAPEKPSLWQNLALWRGLAFGGPVLAALAVAVIITPPPSGPEAAPQIAQTSIAPPALLAASLAAADGTPLLAATWDPLRGTVVLTPVADDGALADRATELWVIEGDSAPRSLGVIQIAAPNAHAISSQVISGLQPGAMLAISIEPIGGSPTGLPTGPVIATGKLTSV